VHWFKERTGQESECREGKESEALPGRVEVLVVHAEAMAGETGRRAGSCSSREGHGQQHLEAEAGGVGEEVAEQCRVLRQHVAHEGGAAACPSRSRHRRCHVPLSLCASLIQTLPGGEFRMIPR
jgi:hypothetical protein